MANLGNTNIFGELKVTLGLKTKTINDLLCPTQVNLAAVDANNNYMEGRGLVVGHSGSDYPGIGYNVRHTTSAGSFIIPRADTASYMFFRNGGFQFGGVAAQAAGATVSFSVNAEITKEGNINSFRLLPASNINGTTYNNAAIEIRELNKAGSQTDTVAIAPRLAFHWNGRAASQIVLRADARIAIMNNPGTDYEGFIAKTIEATGAITTSGIANLNGGLSQDGKVILNGSDSWLRTYDSAGWYNETHGGGIHMIDSSWVRVYNNKGFYSTGEIRSEYGFTNLSRIGTNAANARNHFTGINAGSARMTDGWIAAAFGDTTGNIVVIGQASGKAIIGARSNSLSAWANLHINTDSGNVVVGLPSANADSRTEKFQVFGDGYFGGALSVVGDVFFDLSDERLKTNFESIINPIEKIKQIETGYYYYNDLAKSFGFKKETRQIGVKAQQIQNVLPEAVALAPFDNENGVSKSGDEYLTVRYEKLVPLLIEAVKAQQKEINLLKEKVGV